MEDTTRTSKPMTRPGLNGFRHENSRCSGIGDNDVLTQLESVLESIASAREAGGIVFTPTPTLTPRRIYDLRRGVSTTLGERGPVGWYSNFSPSPQPSHAAAHLQTLRERGSVGWHSCLSLTYPCAPCKRGLEPAPCLARGHLVLRYGAGMQRGRGEDADQADTGSQARHRLTSQQSDARHARKKNLESISSSTTLTVPRIITPVKEPRPTATNSRHL